MQSVTINYTHSYFFSSRKRLVFVWAVDWAVVYQYSLVKFTLSSRWRWGKFVLMSLADSHEVSKARRSCHLTSTSFSPVVAYRTAKISAGFNFNSQSSANQLGNGWLCTWGVKHFLRSETWKTGCTIDPGGNFNLYATVPILSSTSKGHKIGGLASG